MRWKWLSGVVLATAVLVLGCSDSKTSPSGGSTGAKGQFGVFYLVTIPRPVGGTIRSSDGQVLCGSAGSACGPARYGWTEVATFTASADPGFTFYSWAGDCTGSGTCTIDNRVFGADNTVAAAFAFGTSWRVTVAKTGAFGTVQASLPGQPPVTCGPSTSVCDFYVPITNPASVLSLSAAGEPLPVGSTFRGWVGACSGTGTCALTVDRSAALVASFEASTGGGAPPLLTWDTGNWDQALWQ